jgi:hypothetical protein
MSDARFCIRRLPLPESCKVKAQSDAASSARKPGFWRLLGRLALATLGVFHAKADRLRCTKHLSFASGHALFYCYLSANTALPTTDPLMLMSTRYVPTPSADAARL